MPDRVRCAYCDGMGTVANRFSYQIKDCPFCKGRGYLTKAFLLARMEKKIVVEDRGKAYAFHLEKQLQPADIKTICELLGVSMQGMNHVSLTIDENMTAMLYGRGYSAEGVIPDGAAPLEWRQWVDESSPNGEVDVLQELYGKIKPALLHPHDFTPQDDNSD